jgi:hypothetical protein
VESLRGVSAHHRADGGADWGRVRGEIAAFLS